MYYVKDKIKQEQLINKIFKIYTKEDKRSFFESLFKPKNNNIFLEDIQLDNTFKYISYIDNGWASNHGFFFDALFHVCDYTNDEYIDMLITDKEHAEHIFNKELVYPTIHIEKKELSQSEKVFKFVENYPSGNETYFYLVALNICIIPPSFKWLFFMNRDNETGCFVSNDIKINNIFKEQMNKNASMDIFYTEVEYLVRSEENKYAYISLTKEKFYKTSISKLKII